MTKKIDVEKYANKALAAVAVKTANGEYDINGFKVKVSNRGIYLHNKFLPEIKTIFDGLDCVEKRGTKPLAVAKKLTAATIDDIVNRLATNKTKKLLKQEKKEAKVAAKVPKLEKRTWCSDCPFCPQGEKSTECSSLKFAETEGFYYCSDQKFWNWNWCENAEHRVEDESKPWTGMFYCKKTKKLCPYNTKSIIPGQYLLLRDGDGEHFTKCDKYVGRRIETGALIVPPEKEKRRA